VENINDQYYRPATRPNRLPLTSESEFPVKNVASYELPSPTAVSLDGGGGGEVTQELAGACKSSSAPHLIKSTQTLPRRTKYTGGSEVFLEVVHISHVQGVQLRGSVFFFTLTSNMSKTTR